MTFYDENQDVIISNSQMMIFEKLLDQRVQIRKALTEYLEYSKGRCYDEPYLIELLQSIK